MKRTMKKLIAAIATGVMVLSTMSLSVFAGQDATDMEDGTVYFNLNTADWSGPTEADSDLVKITDNGTYTISYTATEEFALGEFNAIEVKNGETVFGRGYTITIDSILLDGEEALKGSSYTCSADGGAVTTRVNIFNKYNDPNEDVAKDGFQDCRAADGDVMSKSARIVDEGLTATKVEVTFTVAGIGDEVTPVEPAEGGEDQTEADEPTFEPITTFPAEVAFKGFYAPEAVYTVTSDVTYVTVTVEYADPVDDGNTFGWNEYCANGIKVTNSDGTEAFYGFGGNSVTWSMSIAAEEAEEVPDGVNNTNKQYKTLTDGSGTFTIPVDGKGATVSFYALGWDTYDGVQYTVSVVDGDGAAEDDQTEADTQAEADTKADTTDKTDDKGSFPTWAIVLIVVVVVVVVVVIIVCATSSKKKAANGADKKDE